ncbi:RNA ligase, phage-associated [Minicystis rosea]|nr:RNA ligase, phage-associated [Minicystis rosea]
MQGNQVAERDRDPTASTMETFLKYPDIVTLDKRPEILGVKQVVATEKLHGSNFRVFFPAGMTSLDEVRYGGRNEIFAIGDDGFYGGKAVRWFKSRPALLQKMVEVFAAHGISDVAVYGEICGAGIQKGVRYAASDEALFRAFDIRVGECFVTYDLFVTLCDEAGLPRVPEIWRGEPSLAAFDALLEKPSTEGLRNGVAGESNLAEGVVIRSTPLLRDVFGNWLIIKHKSEGFSETAHKRSARPGEKVENKEPLESFAATYVTRGRILNAVGRLRDAGAKLAMAMEDIPVLTQAVVVDLHKEEEPAWHALVAAGFNDKQIRAAVTRIVVSVYRRVLLEGIT